VERGCRSLGQVSTQGAEAGSVLVFRHWMMGTSAQCASITGRRPFLIRAATERHATLVASGGFGVWVHGFNIWVQGAGQYLVRSKFLQRVRSVLLVFVFDWRDFMFPTCQALSELEVLILSGWLDCLRARIILSSVVRIGILFCMLVRLLCRLGAVLERNGRFGRLYLLSAGQYYKAYFYGPLGLGSFRMSLVSLTTVLFFLVGSVKAQCRFAPFVEQRFGKS
jgi:hypothetical protein